MNVDEAKVVCQICSMWGAVVSVNTNEKTTLMYVLTAEVTRCKNQQ